MVGDFPSSSPEGNFSSATPAENSSEEQNNETSMNQVKLDSPALESPSSPPVQTFQCFSCLDDFPSAGQFFPCPAHRQCPPCLAWALKEKIREFNWKTFPIRCNAPGCTEIFPEPEIFSLLDSPSVGQEFSGLAIDYKKFLLFSHLFLPPALENPPALPVITVECRFCHQFSSIFPSDFRLRARKIKKILEFEEFQRSQRPTEDFQGNFSLLMEFDRLWKEKGEEQEKAGENSQLFPPMKSFHFTCLSPSCGLSWCFLCEARLVRHSENENFQAHQCETDYNLEIVSSEDLEQEDRENTGESATEAAASCCLDLWGFLFCCCCRAPEENRFSNCLINCCFYTCFPGLCLLNSGGTSKKKKTGRK